MSTRLIISFVLMIGLVLNPTQPAGGQDQAPNPRQPSAVASAAKPVWKQATNGMWGAGFNAFAVSPNYANDHLLLAGANSGMFRSTDSGNAWVHSQGLNAPVGFKSTVFSPNFATDRTAFTWKDKQLYRSTDSGASWSLLFTAAANIYALALSPNFSTDHTALMGTYGNGVYKSTGGGAAWQPAGAGISDIYILSLAFSPNYALDQTVLAGTHGKGAFISTDGGLNWTAKNANLPQYSGGSYYNISALLVSPGYSSDHTLFAQVLGYLYRSTDSAETWIQANDLGSNLFSLVLAPNFADSHLAFASVNAGNSRNLFRSTNGGVNWSVYKAGFQGAIMGISPNFAIDSTLFATGKDGLMRSTNAGSDWAVFRQGLDCVNVSSVAVSPAFAADQTLLVVGNERLFRSTDGDQTWQEVPHGLLLDERIMDVAFSSNFAADHTAFAAGYNGVYRSQDGGDTWVLSSNGLPGLPILSLGISPNFAEDQLVFAGIDDIYSDETIYLSRDGGQTWTMAGPTGAGPAVDFVFSPHFAQDGIVFTLHSGASNDVRYSSGDYILWSNNFPTGTKAVALSPNYPADQTIYSISTQNYSIGPILMKTQDNGESWNPEYYFGPDASPSHLLISPNFLNDHTFYVSFSDQGVRRSINEGQNWVDISAGLGDPLVQTLSWADSAQKLFAGTVRQSLWEYAAGPNASEKMLYLPLIAKP